MQFYSWSFLFLFLPLTILIYYLLNKYTGKKTATYFLILCNFIFYGYAGFAYLFYLCLCIFINYFFAKQLILRRQKSLLIVGLIYNLGALGFLKYSNFFVSSLNDIFKTDFHLVEVFLPLGLSFFTFQFVALLYDCYKGRIADLSFPVYVLFASFFPKITQGPIMVYQDFAAQYDLKKSTFFCSDSFSQGLYAFTLGMGKKILIADVLAAFVNPGFSSNYSSFNSTMLLLLMLAYTLQIYFDFSGYSDMAKGIGLMFQIELPQNFNSPYKALSVNDFWKRWHMSLTGFFTRYLYIPLGGNRKGEFRTYLNVFIVFALSGLWHGASYTFIVWGILHGIASIIERKWKFTSSLHPTLQWIYTFAFVNIAWLFFRSTSIIQALDIIKGIFCCNFTGIEYASLSSMILPEINILFSALGLGDYISRFPVIFIILLLICILLFRNTDEKIKTFKPSIWKAILIIVIMSWSILSFGSKITFIYEMF